MIRHALGIIAVTAIIMAPVRANSQQVTQLDGWQKAKWGMTKEDVKKVFPKATDFVITMKGKQFQKWGLSDYEISGCHYNVDFGFSGDKLNAVDLQLTDLKDGGKCGPKMSSLLVDKYGKPTTSDNEKKRDMETTSEKWLIGNTTITCFTMFMPTISQGLHFIKYKARSSSESGKL